MADDPRGPPLVDDPHAPEIFAGFATGFLNIGGSIAITLETAKSDYSTSPPTLRRVVVGRLIMPVSGAQSLAMGLFDYLKSQGLDPATTSGSGDAAPN